MNKTNAARILDKQGVKYETVSYDVDESDLSAVAIADKIGQNIDTVYKTLVMRGDKTGIFVCIVPGAEEVDLKKAASVSGNKSAAMVPLKELTELTGYIRGGCSPIGMKKKYPAYIDETASLFEYIFVSAGIRGLQFKISPDDLIACADCKIADLIIIGNPD